MRRGRGVRSFTSSPGRDLAPVLLTWQGPVSAVAVEPGGNQMVTAGVDGQVRCCDDILCFKENITFPTCCYARQHTPAGLARSASCSAFESSLWPTVAGVTTKGNVPACRCGCGMCGRCSRCTRTSRARPRRTWTSASAACWPSAATAACRCVPQMCDATLVTQRVQARHPLSLFYPEHVSRFRARPLQASVQPEQAAANAATVQIYYSRRL